ncbi:MAG: 30S ribosomal protein S9 [Patescibacteria group bacterium]
MAKKQNFVFATGKRKEAGARVRLFKGKGENLVNGVPLEKYFPTAIDKALFEKPFKLTQTEGEYYFTAKIKGSGKAGQLTALIHGVARALAAADKDKFRPPLKKAGLLTRDPREKERRKVGTGGKARREKQSPKR